MILRWILLLLVIALAAGALGFPGIKGTALTIARVLFFIVLILFIASFFLLI